jgi:hypothetical protein
VSITAAIREMLDRGLTIEQALIAADVMEANERAKKDEQRTKTAERVRRHRARVTDVTVTGVTEVTSPSPLVPPSLSPEPLNPPPYNPPNPSISVQRKRSTPSEFFDRFWAAYPRRDGANPKQPAAKAFGRAVSAGADPETIILGAQHYRSEQLGKDSRFIAQAVTWLNQERWGDHCQPRLAVVQNATPPPRQQLTDEEVEAQVRAFGIIK